MGAPWAPYGVTKCTKILAFDVQPAGVRLLHHVLVSRFLGSFLKCNFWIVSSMLIKGSRRYRLNSRHIPLQLVGKAHNGSCEPDDVLVGVVDDVLTCRRAYPEKDSLVKSMLVFNLSLGPVLVSASFTKANRVSYGVCPSCPRTRYRTIEAA